MRVDEVIMSLKMSLCILLAAGVLSGNALSGRQNQQVGNQEFCAPLQGTFDAIRSGGMTSPGVNESVRVYFDGDALFVTFRSNSKIRAVWESDKIDCERGSLDGLIRSTTGLSGKFVMTAANTFHLRLYDIKRTGKLARKPGIVPHDMDFSIVKRP